MAKPQHMVVFKMDADPIIVYPYDDLAKARDHYDKLAAGWSQVWLVTVVEGRRIEGLGHGGIGG